MNIKSNKSRNIILNLIFIIVGLVVILLIIFTFYFISNLTIFLTFIAICIWLAYFAYWYRRVYRNKVTDFDYVYDVFDYKDLKEMMKDEHFEVIDDYIEVSEHWLRFNSKYVPNNFIIGSFIDDSSINLALLSGESISLTTNRIEEVKYDLKDVLKHIDIDTNNDFKDYWYQNKLDIHTYYKNNLKSFDYKNLVYNYQDIKLQ